MANISGIFGATNMLTNEVGAFIRPMRDYDRYIKTLKDQSQELVTKRNDLQVEVDAATANGQVILSDVNRWLTYVDKLNEDLGRFLEEDVEVNSTRVHGCFPNLILRYSLSLKAIKKTAAIVEVLEGGKFYRVSYPAPPPVIVNEGTQISSSGAFLMAFTHSKVVIITSDFKDLIGEGGFGKVFLGKLSNGTQVAVKRWSTSSRQGYEEFKAETRMKVNHKNLVCLLGYCDEGDKKALIYEYMANGNLRQYLSEAEASTKILTWEERLQIALDAARELEYLHDGCREPIVHRDVKTSNILLNEKWEAKLADFGLSRAFPTENASHVSTDPKGTNGYIDPEYNVNNKLNKASDIYSFGVVLLELVTGQPAIIRTESNSLPIHISQWVNPLYDEGDIGSIVDPRLQGTYYNTVSAKKVLEIAIDCVKLPASQRQEISKVCYDLMDAERNQKMESEKTSSRIGRSGIFSWLCGCG